MCGICGTLNVNDGLKVAFQMSAAMRHRGPDSDGYYGNGAIALGMRRLRILDLASGDQPIFNEDRSVAVIFNGEIYNYRNLTEELTACGHRFSSQSDTETIIHAYEEWGTECFSRLRGMFSLAIVDNRKGHRPEINTDDSFLVLARDRLGIKPLYIWQNATRFLFASEVRALLASGDVPRKLSLSGLHSYLSFGSVQEPLALIEGITSLPPGTWLQVELGHGHVITKQGSFWGTPGRQQISNPVEKVREALLDAVQSHLVSDVPLGAFLSGGLDSGALVAYGSQASDSPMRTFTMAFNDGGQDERELAGLTAQLWSTRHEVRVVHQGDILADLPQVLASMDQPTFDGVNTWYVAREARRSGLTVALSGLGGDELFGGYPSFRQVPLLKKIVPFVPRMPGAERMLAGIFPGSDRSRKLRALLSGSMPFDHPYFLVRGFFTEGDVRALLHPTAREHCDSYVTGMTGWRTSVDAEVERARSYDTVGEVSWLELTQYTRSTLLRDTDFMSMAHSLEVRVPFLDHLFVEAILSIEGSRKVYGRGFKPLLSEALSGRLPDEVLHGRKHTFTFPFEHWLRGELSKEVSEMLQKESSYVPGVFSHKAVLDVWSHFQRGHTNWARPWALYVLLHWMRDNNVYA